MFGVELEPDVHGVIIARPRDGTIEPLWPDAHVRVGEREVAIRSILDRQEFTGTHHPTAILIAAGGPILHLDERQHASVLDLAPLLFHLAGEPVPDDLEGRVPTDWLDLDALGPVERRPAAEFPALPRPTARPESPAQKRELEEKLRGLGYIE